MHVLIAPNAFKNSLTATAAVNAIQRGLELSRLKCTYTRFPIADGGDGTASLIIEKCKGKLVEKEVHDPLGRRINASFGLIDNEKTAVIEMADATGMKLLKKNELNPLIASSFGTGEQLKQAMDEGVNKIIIAMGGSATVDGGCGILNALGIRFFNADGEHLAVCPQSLASLATIDASQLDQRIFNCEIIILCDVNNRLLGSHGSAAVFGPQKGASKNDIVKLESFLTCLDKITEKQTGIKISELKYGGTAGGAAAGLHAFLNAKLVNGIEYFLQLTGFEEELQQSDILITGEGSIDKQTLQGKGPFGVANMAKQKNVPVIGLAGIVPLEHDAELEKYFDVLMAIGNSPMDINEAIKYTGENLTRTAKIIGDMLALK